MILSPLLLACAAVPQAPAQAPTPPPLIAGPEGWLTERLAFPLGFAPELDYRGFEDLAFAPGMFDTKSDSYFSYALAIRLDGDVPLDAPALERFFEAYFAGLYRAVAADKGLAIEGRPTTASVAKDGERFRATVRTFDAFTGGGALTLALELDVHGAPRATEILGLASPKPADAAVWKPLRELRERWRAARPAPVFLNHAFAVVDRATYDALAQSKFLREQFGVGEERTTKRADVSYSGLYFYGRRTYFEFLPPESSAGLAAGGSGVALGVESAGALDTWAARLSAAGVGTGGGPITRELAGEPVPWFKILGVEMPVSALQVFAMEYEPAFLARWHPDLPPAQGGIARADVLARYAAALKQTSLAASAPFADVAAVELALDPAQRERLVAICKAAGHEIEVQGERTTVFGPQFQLRITPRQGPGGVTAIELALRSELRLDPMQFGRATLRFSGTTARFELD